ncbi:MAG: choice-of-anchor D domain-containing protein [bacterium]
MTISFGGVNGFTYFPKSFNVTVGDTIQWVGDFTTYPLHFTSIPSNSAPIPTINLGDTFKLIIHVEGQYNYQSDPFLGVGMTGSFSAAMKLLGLSNEGKEFYLGLFTPSYNSIANGAVLYDYRAYAIVSSYYNNIVTFSYYDDAGVETVLDNVRIVAGKSAQVLLNRKFLQMDTASDIPSYRSCHVKSTYPISVNVVSVGGCAGGSYLALPVLGLGSRYIAACYNDNPGNGAAYDADTFPPKTYEFAGGIFIVIASQDNTSVKITPTTPTVTGHTGSHSLPAHPYSIKLNRGQCYLVKSNGRNDEADLSASLIESTSPVAVISGHENAFLGGVEPFLMEGRDLMVEQMIPEEYWSDQGSVMIPLAEPTPSGTVGNGDTYRIFTFENANVKAHLDVQGIAGGFDFPTQRLAVPPERGDITAPVDAYSLDSKKILLMQYDERSQTNNSPFPAPSMTSIVPYARWSTSIQFATFSDFDPAKVVHSRYINILGSNLQKVQISVDGGFPTSLSTLTKITGYSGLSSRIPGLTGATYKIPSTGSNYRLTSVEPFMVYFYGMRLFTADNHLGEYNYANFVDEYSAPAGMQLNTGVYPSFITDIQTTCSGWHVCIRDTGANDPGVKAAILIDDPDGVYWNTPAKFSNVSFDETSSDFADGELHPHVHSNSAYCFDVNFVSPLAAASAPLAIVDNLGNAIILRLDRPAPAVKLITSPPTSSRSDSIVFPVKKIGEQICTTFVLKNTAAKGGAPINLNAVTLTAGDPTYIASTTMNFPHAIVAGDSALVQVCYTPIDSLRHQDSLILKTDCFNLTITLDAHGSTGLISASDLDFKSIVAGDTSCKSIQVKNVGSAPFTLTGANLSDTINYSINLASLPKQLAVGASAFIQLCFHPTTEGSYPATIEFQTDLEPSFKHSVKDKSLITAQATPKAGVKQGTETNFSIRPNPVNGNYVTMTLASESPTESRSYSVYDVLGREMLHSTIPVGQNEIQIPIQTLAEGMYYVRLSAGGATESRSFTKVR